jgi:hypothetical protein
MEQRADILMLGPVHLLQRGSWAMSALGMVPSASMAYAQASDLS